MRSRSLIAALVVLAFAAGCGQAAGGGGGSQPPGSTGAGATVAGVLLGTDSAHPNGGSPEAGIRIGLYTRPITTVGPVMANPPKPIMTTRTGPDGTFTFAVAAQRPRYFVAPIDARGYAPGRWARPGAQVRLVACTDCPVPL
jgi:hypothetical protein